MKVGGVWVDANEVAQKLGSISGVSHAFVFNGAAFVCLTSVAPGVMAALRRALPANISLFIVPEIPKHPGTGKVDRSRLERMVSLHGSHGHSAAELLAQQELFGEFNRWYLPLLALLLRPVLALATSELSPGYWTALLCICDGIGRWLSLSYLLLLVYWLVSLQSYLNFCPLGHCIGLLALASLAPRPCVLVISLPGAYVALRSGRLLSWPCVCLVGFPVWAQESGIWWLTASGQRIRSWCMQSMKDKVPVWLRRTLYLTKTCNECKKTYFRDEGRIDISVDKHWYCNKCWKDFYRHWQCASCSKWVSKGRPEESLGPNAWVCLRCAKDIDAKEQTGTVTLPGNADWVQHYQVLGSTSTCTTSREGGQAVGAAESRATRVILEQRLSPQVRKTQACPGACPDQAEGRGCAQEAAVDELSASLEQEKSPTWKLVEKAVGWHFQSTEDQLLGIDSLRFTKLTSALLRDDGKQLPRDALKRCSTLGELLAEVASLSAVSESSSQEETHPAWGMMWRSHCIWTLNCDRIVTLPILRRAVEELVWRHTALRSVPIEPMPFFTAVQKALSILQLWRLGSTSSGFRSTLMAAASWGLKKSWPRVRSTAVDIERVLKVLSLSSDVDAARRAVRDYRIQEKWWEPPFEVTVAPYRNADDSQQGMLINLDVTHMFSDGFCIVPLMTDLATLVSRAEQGLQPDLPPLPNPLTVLHPRILRTIEGDDSLGDAVTPQPLERSKWCEDVACIAAQMHPALVAEVKRAAIALVVTDDILMLAALGITLAKLHGQMCITIQTVAPQRDGPKDSLMVGLFSDNRWIDIRTEGLNHAGVALVLHRLVKERLWRPPPAVGQGDVPFVNFEWTDFEEHHGFAQIVNSSRRETSLSSPLKVAVDQPDRQSWQLRVSFDNDRYPVKEQDRFFDLLEESLEHLIDDPLALVHSGQ